MEIQRSHKVALGHQDWEDLVDTAGYEIGYWATSAVVDEDAETYTVTEHESHDGESSPVHVITKPDLEAAYAKVLNREVQVCDEVVGYCTPDEYGETDIDAAAADVLVQVAAFGEIVYG